MDNSDGKLVYCYDVYVNGIFGRNRKAKRESFKLAKHLPAQLTLDQALALMDAKLKEIKIKGTATYSMVERQGRVKHERGFEIYTTGLFTDNKTLRQGTLTNV